MFISICTILYQICANFVFARISSEFIIVQQGMEQSNLFIDRRITPIPVMQSCFNTYGENGRVTIISSVDAVMRAMKYRLSVMNTLFYGFQ